MPSTSEKANNIEADDEVAQKVAMSPMTAQTATATFAVPSTPVSVPPPTAPLIDAADTFEM
jgi:hypothetical protein